ncbi:porin OmpA [Candidatus Pantoea edessiphila]|uniref:Outer membrane protein A n=1 Tax=Candidatus Pantoea edessiphila TaxID=2044610 RepID=A0A2P5T2H8_9GAMM|nr:porin OmpA [Candidatus Pantoea edessiphila]PPI88763.1 porin OmpA [Candidatus Pantoea edessiphila]
MKKIVNTAVAVLLAGFSIFVKAMPQKEVWYIGSKLGWSHFYNTDEHYGMYLSNDGNTYKNTSSNNFFFGFQANPNIGFEFNYDVLGSVAYGGHKIVGEFRPYDFNATFKLSYPIFGYLDVYARIGGMLWYATSDQIKISNDNFLENSDSGLYPYPLIAGGLEYFIHKNVALRLDLQWINIIGNKYTLGSQPRNGLLSVGFSYIFNPHDLPRSIYTYKKTPLYKDVKHFNLQADILFKFNDFALTNEGEQVLDKLYDQLEDLDRSTDLIIVGFTDKIGSHKYNQQLSNKRAKSVLNYLVSKGIYSDRMSINSNGKSHSITKSNCDNIKERKSIIECLAPDRRVEINIKNNINNNLKDILDY